MAGRHRSNRGCLHAASVTGVLCHIIWKIMVSESLHVTLQGDSCIFVHREHEALKLHFGQRHVDVRGWRAPVVKS